MGNTFFILATGNLVCFHSSFSGESGYAEIACPEDRAPLERDPSAAAGRCRSQRNRIAIKGLTHAEYFPAKVNAPPIMHFANPISRSVFNRRKRLRIRTLADPIPTRRNLHPQRLVRTIPVVGLPPLCKPTLTSRPIPKRLIAKHLCAQCPVEPFRFPLGLRMIRTPMNPPNPQANPPHRQRRVRMLPVIAPRRPVVHQNPFRHSVPTEPLHQTPLHGAPFLVLTRKQSHQKPRMIVQDRQRITTSLRRLKMP